MKDTTKLSARELAEEIVDSIFDPERITGFEDYIREEILEWRKSFGEPNSSTLAMFVRDAVVGFEPDNLSGLTEDVRLALGCDGCSDDFYPPTGDALW